MQEEIIEACGCYHTEMDLSLLDEEKVTEDKRRPCSMTRNGNMNPIPLQMLFWY